MKPILLLAFVCLLCLPFAVVAQDNRSRTIQTKTPPVSPIRADAERVANQIKNLSRFIYLLGSISKDIETIDAAIQKKQASKATIAQNQDTKTKLAASFANWRIAMDDLEKNFKTKTYLQKYYSKVSGIGSLAAVAQDQAQLGQYNQAGQTCLQIINKLTDALLEMP